MDYKKESLALHYKWKGKLKIESKIPLTTKQELALAYTPGVAEPCLEIQKDISKSYELTMRHNLVAVITDGTAVLGLGDIGPEAGMPVMEGKCLLFREFGGIDAVPLCVKTKNVDEFVDTVYNISSSFGGINLEDISAPRCFEIERKLKERCDIPIFHDDQHGTAVVILSGLINALKITGKSKENMTVVINGAGAAGIASAKLLISYGFGNIILAGREGALNKYSKRINTEQLSMLECTNKDKREGDLNSIISGADIFIGLSAANVLTTDMVKKMNKDPIVFAMANPVPEIMPDIALSAGARVVGTGRSDFPNQINNVLAFPGIFRGTFDCRAKDITDNMKLAAANAIANIITDGELREDYVIPDPFDRRVVPNISRAVSECAISENLNRI